MKIDDKSCSDLGKKYKEKYFESIKNPEKFWKEIALSRLDWEKVPTEFYSGNLVNGDAKWFADGRLNVSYNCIDRHVLAGLGGRVAYYYESDSGLRQVITYNDLLENVSRLANVLKSQNIKKGDTVCIYMPSIPEAIYSMLACTRIGAIHSVVFAGFSLESLKKGLMMLSAMQLSQSILFFVGERNHSV